MTDAANAAVASRPAKDREIMVQALMQMTPEQCTELLAVQRILLGEERHHVRKLGALPFPTASTHAERHSAERAVTVLEAYLGLCDGRG